MAEKYIHICEVCGRTEILTPEEAHMQGWDYPPIIGSFGIVSPRTCGCCPIVKTFWYALASGEIKSLAELNDHQKEVLERIRNEPASITPKEDG